MLAIRSVESATVALGGKALAIGKVAAADLSGIPNT